MSIEFHKIPQSSPPDLFAIESFPFQEPVFKHNWKFRFYQSVSLIGCRLLAFHCKVNPACVQIVHEKLCTLENVAVLFVPWAVRSDPKTEIHLRDISFDCIWSPFRLFTLKWRSHLLPPNWSPSSTKSSHLLGRNRVADGDDGLCRWTVVVSDSMRERERSWVSKFSWTCMGNCHPGPGKWNVLAA